MSKSMKNVAYTKEYLEQYNDYYYKTLSPGCSIEEEREELGNGIYILSKRYSYIQQNPENPQILCRYQGSENVIFRNDIEIHSYRTIHDFNRCTLFAHQNGHEYLFYKRDLYGYSVFDLKTGQDFSYYPAASLPFAETETFIWCEVFYNPVNNIIAVSGCYWACPYGIILADFTDPQNSEYIEKYGYIEEIYHSDDYEYEYEFFDWDGTDLILRDYENHERKRIIKNEEYTTWFNK